MSSLRVMVVDDDPGFGEFVRKVAQGCGYEVTVAHDGREFRSAYAQTKPDLILLDLAMPGADGIELLRSLADNGCTASVMVMSGFDAKVVDTARRLGVARGLQMGRVLTKPIRAADLRTVLEDAKQGLESHAS